IVKRVGVVPIVTDATNKANMDELKSKLNESDRVQVSKNLMIEKALRQIPIKKYSYPERELMVLADSLLDGKRVSSTVSITKATPLFSISDKTFTVGDYIGYAQAWRFKTDGSGLKPFAQVMNEFMHHQAEEYYRSHLEDFNSEFRSQMNEFKDGNLFFE